MRSTNYRRKRAAYKDKCRAVFWQWLIMVLIGVPFVAVCVAFVTALLLATTGCYRPDIICTFPGIN